MKDRIELKEFDAFECKIRVWKRSDYKSNWTFAPWLFSIQKNGEPERLFTGVPNYCESIRSAYMRGYHRAKWLSEGEWGNHYKAFKYC